MLDPAQEEWGSARRFTVDCVLAASKTETFPGTERITAFFDVQAPTVAFPLGDKMFLSRQFYQVLQYSEPTNALSNYKYLELQNTALNSVIEVSPTLCARGAVLTPSHLVSVNYNQDVGGSGQLLFPEGVIQDDAKNKMVGRPVLRYHTRIGARLAPA